LAAVAGTQPSSAISWQPLQMPRLKLSGLQRAGQTQNDELDAWMWRKGDATTADVAQHKHQWAEVMCEHPGCESASLTASMRLRLLLLHTHTTANNQQAHLLSVHSYQTELLPISGAHTLTMLFRSRTCCRTPGTA
jgi:hypothetical protein